MTYTHQSVEVEGTLPQIFAFVALRSILARPLPEAANQLAQQFGVLLSLIKQAHPNTAWPAVLVQLPNQPKRLFSLFDRIFSLFWDANPQDPTQTMLPLTRHQVVL